MNDEAGRRPARGRLDLVGFGMEGNCESLKSEAGPAMKNRGTGCTQNFYAVTNRNLPVLADGHRGALFNPKPGRPYMQRPQKAKIGGRRHRVQEVVGGGQVMIFINFYVLISFD